MSTSEYNRCLNSNALVLTDINNDPDCRPLSPEEEKALLEKRNDPDPQIRQKTLERLLKANINDLVIPLAKKYVAYGDLELSDLINEGSLGLMKAINQFDPKKGERLAPYGSKVIKSQILRALNKGEPLKISSHMHDRHNRFKKAEESLSQKLQGQPTLSELSQELGLDLPTTEWFSKLTNDRRVFSLDQPLRSEDENSPALIDFIADAKTDPEREVLRREVIKKMQDLFKHLPERERLVMNLVLTLALNSGPRAIQVTIAKNLGISRERVRQIIKRALRRLETDPLSNEATKEILELLQT